MDTLASPLNKAQLELLKLFSRVSSEEELMDLKRLFTQYYAERLMNKVDKLGMKEDTHKQTSSGWKTHLLNWMLRVLIDTNVFLTMVSRKSAHHWLFRAFLDGVFELALTSEILTEYEEQFAHHWNHEAAVDIMNVLLEAPNTIFATVHYRFNLIKDDPDDNKFADCAVASGADYLITFDRHFAVLKEVRFPSINVIHPNNLKTILNLK